MSKIFSSVLLCCFLSGVATAAAQPLTHVQKNGVPDVVHASSPVVSKANAIAIAMVVQAQLDAFAADDALLAFSYAAPNIKAMFGTPAKFLRMVKSSYPVVLDVKKAPKIAPKCLIYLTNYWWVVQGSNL